MSKVNFGTRSFVEYMSGRLCTHAAIHRGDPGRRGVLETTKGSVSERGQETDGGSRIGVVRSRVLPGKPPVRDRGSS